jgi:hypothetical protein
MSKKLPLAWLVLVSLSLPLAAAGQSLGSVAKKERERRDKNKQEGVEAREFTEEEVFGDSTAESEGTEAAGEAEAEPGETPAGDPMPAVKEEERAKGNDARDRESRERKRSEAEWRSRVSAARGRIAQARERVKYFEELYLGPNEYYVDANGNKVYESADQLQRLTREAKEELAAAEKDWKAMQDEARRGGVPPGWLR